MVFKEISEVYGGHFAMYDKHGLHDLFVIQCMKVCGGGPDVLQVVVEKLWCRIMPLGEIIGEDAAAYPK